MTVFRYDYIKAYRDRHGKQRYYYRRPGFPSVALPGDPKSREFREAYELLHSQERAPIGIERTKEGSFSALIAVYLRSPAFTGLRDQTRRTYQNDLKRFRQQYGDMSAKTVKRQHVIAMLDDLGGKSEKSLRRMLSILLGLAYDRGWRTDNPMVGLRRKRKAHKGFRPWSVEDIGKFEEKWQAGSRERLALYLLLCTIQRRSDVVGMGRQHVKEGRIRVVQSKTGTPLWIPIHRKLDAELALVPADQLTFVLTQYGKPFSPAGFTNWFSEKAQTAGCPKGCSPHGLRKAGLSFLAEAGCSAKELMALSGHKSLSEVTLYTEAADQVQLADSAMQKLEQRTSGSNPDRPVRQSGSNVQ